MSNARDTSQRNPQRNPQRNQQRNPQRNRRIAAGIAVSCALALGACGSSPPVRYFTLQGAATATATATAAEGAAAVAPAAALRSVQLVGLSLPEAVDRPQLVSRSGENTLSVHEYARWAEPLKSAFAVVLAAEMRAALGGAPVVVRAAGIEDTAWRLGIDVQRFDAQPGQAVVLEAVWTLRGRADGKSGGTISRASVVREALAGGSLEAMVAAQSRATARLAQEIAGVVDAQARLTERSR